MRQQEAPENQTRPEASVRILPAALLALLTAVAIYLCWTMAAPFVNALTWGFALTVACDPARKWLFARMNPGLATAVIMILLMVTIAVPLSLLLQQLLQESLKAKMFLQNSVQPGQWREAISANRWAGPVWMWLDQQLDLADIARQVAGTIAQWLGPAVVRSASVVSQTGVALLAFFFFMRDQESLLAGLKKVLPLSPPEADSLFMRSASAVRSAVYGRVFIGFIQGTLGGLMFAVLGLPAPIFWGTIMSFLSLLPMFGAFIVWIPAAAFLIAGAHWIRALILVVWGVGVINPVDNILYPVLVGDRIGLHPLVLFIAFVGGLVAFGPAGLILGPCIVAFSAGLADIWRARMRTASEAVE